jgi:hypothetical protein
MKAARILLLGVALAAGGAAALLIGPGEEKPQLSLAKSGNGTLSFAVRSLFDAGNITEVSTSATTVSAPFALVSAAAKNAS